MPPETSILWPSTAAVNHIKTSTAQRLPGAPSPQGSLYGTTYCNGRYTAGTVFKLTPSNGSWVYSLLHEFTNGADGGFPYSTVTLDSAGNAYGTTTLGGDSSGNCIRTCGVVWEISP